MSVFSKLKNVSKIKNSPYLNTLVNRFVYCVCSFLANALITRALGVQLKGEYTWVVNTANIFAIVAGLGVYQSIPYYSREGLCTDLLQEYIDIFIGQMCIYCCICLIVSAASQNHQIALICILALLDTLTQQLNMLMLTDNIYKRNRIYLAGSVVNLLVSILCFLCFKNNLDIAVICLLTVKGFYIIGYLCEAGKVPKPWRMFKNGVVGKVRFGFIPMLTFLLITMNYRIDVIMLKANSSVSAAALSYYSAAVSIAEIAWVIPDCFKEVLFSRTSDKKNDEEVASALRVSNVVIGITILGIILVGRFFIILFYGADFAPSYMVTILLFLGIPAMSWFKIIYTYFNAIGKRKVSFTVLLISTILNVALNYLLIPVCGIYGAAVASIFSYSLCGSVFLFLYSRQSNIKLTSLFIPGKNDLRKLVRRGN